MRYMYVHVHSRYVHSRYMYLSIVDSIKKDKKNAGCTLPGRATGIDKDKHAYTLTSDGFIEIIILRLLP